MGLYLSFSSVKIFCHWSCAFALLNCPIISMVWTFFILLLLSKVQWFSMVSYYRHPLVLSGMTFYYGCGSIRVLISFGPSMAFFVVITPTHGVFVMVITYCLCRGVHTLCKGYDHPHSLFLGGQCELFVLILTIEDWCHFACVDILAHWVFWPSKVRWNGGAYCSYLLAFGHCIVLFPSYIGRVKIQFMLIGLLCISAL